MTSSPGKHVSPIQISRLFWLWIPLLVFAGQIVLESIVSGPVLSELHSEGGPHETAQFVVMTLAFLVALRILFLPALKSSPLLYGWAGVAALSCFYVAGEEISWGQHILNWSTPEYWLAINDQGETNLHNTSSWLDQKPRLILEIGVLVGGIIIPLLRRFKPAILPKRPEIIYPPTILSVTAVLALLITIVDKIDNQLDAVVLFERASEVEELYIFYFVLLYLLALKSRLVHNQR